jgi:Protein of unknown function (DUF3617)
MRLKTRIAICAAAGLATAAAVAYFARGLPAGRAAERLKPGQWSVATALGNAAYGEPSSICMSAEDALAANGSHDEIAEAAMREGAGQSCSVQEVLVRGPTVTIDMTCQGLPAKSTMTYGGTSYEGQFATGIGQPNGRTIKIKAWRVGECK